MPTPYRGYTEVPGSTTPDVPYRVNLALREIDADVQDLDSATRETDAQHAARIAALEAAAGFGSGMQLQDEAVNGLLNSPTSATSATVRRQIETQGTAATVKALETEGTPTRQALDRFTLDHLAATYHGPLEAWGAALANQKTRAAVWVSLGSSTAAGGSPRFGGQAVIPRIATWLTGRSMLNNAALGTLTDAKARPATGIHVYQGALGGTTSQNYLDAAKVQAITALQPDLVTHMVGSNDYGSGVGLTTYKSRMRNWLDTLKAASPNTVHLLIHQQARNDIKTPAYPWADYGKALAEVAELYPNVAFFDASVYFPPEGQMPGHIMAEAIHMNENGHRILARVLAAAMGHPIYDAGPEVMVPTITGADTAASTPATDICRLEIPPAPYPREITMEGQVYAYGKFAVGATNPVEVSVRLGYTDNSENPIPSGPNLQLRLQNGGVGYAATYGFARTYHLDANRMGYAFLIAGANAYVSGNGLYTSMRVTAVPA